MPTIDNNWYSVAEWRARLLTVREVSRSNPGNLPLLQMWHVGNVTGRHAIYTLIQCTPLLVEKAGVTPDVTFRITACKQERVQVRYPLWIWNPWGRTYEVQNRSNQWLHKKDLGPDKKNFKKTKKTKQLIPESSLLFLNLLFLFSRIFLMIDCFIFTFFILIFKQFSIVLLFYFYTLCSCYNMFSIVVWK